MSKLVFTLVQTQLHWENKNANLLSLDQKITGLENAGHIIVLPEMFNTGFSMNPQALAEDMNGATMNWLIKKSKERKVILTGSFIAKDGDQFYNRLVWVLPDGNYGYYDKRHLFAFAGEDKQYSAGEKRLIASVNGWKINLMVCYDLRFPVWSRQQMHRSNGFEYDVLVYVANWPEKRNLAWKTLLRARAIENQCYVVAVNRVGRDGNDIYYSGDSMVIDPLGEVLDHREHEEDIFSVGLDREKLDEVRSKFPFWKDADDFELR